MKKQTYFILWLALGTSPFAFAGKEGGGGKAVVCRDEKDKVQSVELLDLWEARNVYRFKIKPSTAPVQAQITQKIEALKDSTQIQLGADFDGGSKTWTEPEYLAHWLDERTKLFLNKNSKSIYPIKDAALVPTDDSYEVAIPEGRCKIEQVVNYVDSAVFPHILINEQLLNKMDNTNKAALYLHEAFYVFLRGYSDLSIFDQNHDTNSIRVRRAIGYVFGGNSFTSLDSLLPEKYLACHAQNSRPPTMPSTFYLYNDSQGNTFEVTTQLFGKRMIGLSTGIGSSIVPSELTKVEKCDNAGVPDPHQMGPGIYNIYGSGPVDYQNQVWLSPDCDHNKTVMMLEVDSQIGPFNQEAQEIYCAWTDKNAAKQSQ
jgi:hypothetical protein